MRKTLTPVGNSLALVIDKPIREVLGIARETVLEVTFDGRRIVVVPIGLPERDELDPFELMKELVNAYELRQDGFVKLHGSKLRMWAFWAWLQDRGNDLNEEHQRTVRRMRACLASLQGGAALDAAIEAAASVP